MAVQLDLRPDRNLLDPNFESYRLSLDSFPILKKGFLSGVQCIELTDDQYSFLHAHLLSLINHLFYDFWAEECVFFVDESCHIQWSRLSTDGRLSDLRVVWQLPLDTVKQCKANATLSFAGQEWAVVSDGSKQIYLLNTPSRSEGEPWQLCHSHELEQTTSPCILLYSLHHQYPSSHQIECLLASVCKWQDLRKDCKSNPSLEASQSEDSFICVLEWITFSCLLGNETSEWHVKSNRILVGKSVPVYACFEPGSSCINLVAEKEFTFVYDSQKQCISEHIENGDKPKASKSTALYTYMQSLEDVTVLFKVSDGLCKSSVSVHMEANALLVKVDDKPMISGTLAGTIDVSGSTWTMEGNKLELTLSKCKTGELWKELVLGDTRGQEIHDAALIEDIHNRLAHLTSATEAVDEGKPAYNQQELDDCDFSVSILTFQRLDAETHQATHQSNLGGHQFLFTGVMSTESLPVLCLRHDIDGIVWQPKNTASEGELQNFKIDHTATFPALGYVLASKQDRKFIVSSPDFGFAAVCDGSRHVYIYRQPESLNSALELRNRKTGQDISKIAKQHVINLEESGAILGLHASRDCIFVLSKKALFGIKM